MSDFLNIDYLRNLEAKPYWFGLGFIQLKLNDKRRIHFWDISLDKNVGPEELHDHRYDFHSTVLAGKLKNEIWHFEPNPAGDWEMVSVSCDKDNRQASKFISRGHTQFIAEHHLQAGDTYQMHRDTFHVTSLSQPTVTLLDRSSTMKDMARVVRPFGSVDHCPFSVVLPEKEVWERIESILNECTKTKNSEDLTSPPGYHLRKIEKGTLGESSKILEEIQELMDAESQRVKIMQLVELSDIYGSLSAYLKKHFPDIDMKDLEDMHKVTKRAFENGHR